MVSRCGRCGITWRVLGNLDSDRCPECTTPDGAITRRVLADIASWRLTLSREPVGLTEELLRGAANIVAYLEKVYTEEGK